MSGIGSKQSESQNAARLRPEMTGALKNALKKVPYRVLICIQLCIHLTGCGFLIAPVQLASAELASSAVIATDASIRIGASASSKVAQKSVTAYQRSASLAQGFWIYLDNMARREEVEKSDLFNGNPEQSKQSDGALASQ